MPMFKAGVVMWKMAPEIESKLDALDDIHEQLVGRPALITSARDGTHSKKSLHYQGKAIDLRTNDVPKDKHPDLVKAIKNALGNGFDVVYEATHIHVEYDPK